MVQLQESVLGKAAYKSASLMKDMDELTKKARSLLAEVALPCFVCTHDHSKYLAMEQHYYNKGRTIINESEEKLMRVKSDLQQCQKQVEQGRISVSNAKVELAWAKFLRAANVWSGKLGSQEDVDTARRALERYEMEFQKAQSSLKEIEEEKIQAELVQACLMSTLLKHLAMDRYFYSKEGKKNCGYGLMTMKSSAVQQRQRQVEKAKTDVRSAENDLKDKTKMMVKFAALVAVYGGTFGSLAYESVVKRIGYFGRRPLVVGMGSISAVIIILAHQQDVDRYRIELGKRKKLYQIAQDSLKIQQKVDTETNNDTCTFLKDHGWYYCNEEGTRQQSAAEVHQAIIAKRTALQQCRQQVEQARTHLRCAENKLRDSEQMWVKVGAVMGVLAFIGGPVTAVLMASSVGVVATGMIYLVDRSRNTLERCKGDYQRYQKSLKKLEHDLDTMEVELDKFTHLTRPKLVSVEWRQFYRHRHIVFNNVKVNIPEIEVKMNTRLQYYFSKFSKLLSRKCPTSGR